MGVGIKNRKRCRDRGKTYDFPHCSLRCVAETGKGGWSIGRTDQIIILLSEL
jgi:hypothetical protein